MRPPKALVSAPTWRGFVENTEDALRIFEACFNGTLSFCSGRPENLSVIVSGNVFVYDKSMSRIKRWTDGCHWSPSRTLTNFLIYRQLDDGVPPQDRRRARKQVYEASNSSHVASIREEYEHSSCHGSLMGPTEIRRMETEDRRLVGSLTGSYTFKTNGLMKKAMNITMGDRSYQLIAYYSINDAKFHLKTPRDDPWLKDLPIRDSLMVLANSMSSSMDDTGDDGWTETQDSQDIPIHDHQFIHYPQLPHPASQYNFDQVEWFWPNRNHGVDTLASFLQTASSTVPSYAHDSVSSHLEPCLCACHSQDQNHLPACSHQSSQPELVKTGFLWEWT